MTDHYLLTCCDRSAAPLSTDATFAVFLKLWTVLEQYTRLTNPGAAVVGEPSAAFFLLALFKAFLLVFGLFKLDYVPPALALNSTLRPWNLTVSLPTEAVWTFWNIQL